MKNRNKLNVQQLEQRDVPATFGIGWANSDNLTLSFARDGSLVDGQSSNLFATMRKTGLSDAQWQNEILRAFQTWAQQANINIGVVSDSGAALGAAGQLQGDDRFGDIRIFARSLSSNVFAITVPPGNDGSTRTGDIIINSNFLYGIGQGNYQDLYTVMLQEAGHALGVGNSADPLSPMFESYNGINTGLTAADVESITSIYGARSYNNYEVFSNQTSDRATAIAPPMGVSTLSNLSIIGDVSTNTDIDWYRYTAQAGFSSMTISLQTNATSLLAGRLTVLDANLNVIGTATATAPGQNLSLTIRSVTSGARYFIRVESAPGTSFAVGAYRLNVLPNKATDSYTSVGGMSYITDFGLNDTQSRAMAMSSQMYLDRLVFSGVGTTGSSTDVDFFKVKTQVTAATQQLKVTVSLKYYGGDVPPNLEIYNAAGQLQTFTTVTNYKGLLIIELSNAESNTEYFICVKANARSSNLMPYQLRVVSQSFATAPPVVCGVLGNGFSEYKAQVKMSTAGYVNVGASLDNLTKTTITGSATLRIVNAFGQKVLELSVRDQDDLNKSIFLLSGDYTITLTLNSNLTDQYAFDLFFTVISDPIGVMPSDPTLAQAKTTTTTTDSTSTVPPPPSTTTTTTTTTYYMWTTDPSYTSMYSKSYPTISGSL